ncbi:hypothetical protein U9M48_004070 [Paspalum notatum var. saurae]|uniref:Auxin-responsive protein n=1 Tax=Paspalum notatum var. saurae TaxID=547442 RepID=A0AAQ3PJD2_PASNO
MLNLAPFETPPLGRQQERANIPVATTAATTIIRAKEASSSDGTCFHGDLDLSLGISLSHGGSSYDATGCGNKASHGGRQGSCGDDDVRGCVASSGNTTVNVITDGHCGGHVGDLTVGGGWAAAAFMPSPTSFMHPWSLAARQQKAAAEQDRTPPAAYVPRYMLVLLITFLSPVISDAARAVPLPSSAVGWPPVHTSRRNIVTSMQMQLAKPAVTIDGPKSTTTHAGGDKKVAAAPTDSTVVATRPPPPPAANMFAKVHMEGYAIGRKINLRAQGSYDSLSRVLTKMTTNFFCRKYHTRKIE